MFDMWFGTKIKFSPDAPFKSPFRGEAVLVPYLWSKVCTKVIQSVELSSTYPTCPPKNVFTKFCPSWRHQLYVFTFTELILRNIPFRYNMTTHLKAHQGIHRTTNKTHSCPSCPMTFNKLPTLAEHMTSAHNMKMELPNRSNRLQKKSQTLKSGTMPDADAANVIELVSEADLASNYSNSDSNFITIMDIKNEFAGNVQ